MPSQKKLTGKTSFPIGLSFLAKLWPLILVPLTIIAVKQFGHDGANVLLGALFILVFAKKADLKTRRLMIVLAVLSGLFETANVASGAYQYFGALGSPLWISLGWAILGWWFVQLTKEAEKISFNAAFAATAIVIALASFANQTLTLTTPISIAALYALSLAVRQPFALYAFVSLFAIIAEWSGTFGNVWGYFNLNHQPVPPDLATLAMAYPIVMAFSVWVSGYENEK